MRHSTLTPFSVLTKRQPNQALNTAMEEYKGHLGKDYKLFTLVNVCARIQTPTTFNSWSYPEGWVDLRAVPDAAVRKI